MANLKYFPKWFLSETENCLSQKSTSALTSIDQWLFCHEDVYLSARGKMWQKCVAREGGGGGGGGQDSSLFIFSPKFKD